MTVCECPVGPPVGPTLAATCGGSSFMLFMGLLEVFLRSQCDLEDPCGRPKVYTLLTQIRENRLCTYKYVDLITRYTILRPDLNPTESMTLLWLAADLVDRW